MTPSAKSLALHLLAATSMPLAAAAAFCGVLELTQWLELDRLAEILDQSARPAVTTLTAVAYLFYAGRTVLSYSRGGKSPEVTKSETRLKRITLNFWGNIGSTVGLFLALLGVAWVFGVPAELSHARSVPAIPFSWLKVALNSANAAIFVFVLMLTATYGLRGVARNFHLAMHGVRMPEWRRNLPLEVAILSALPVFVSIASYEATRV